MSELASESVSTAPRELASELASESISTARPANAGDERGGRIRGRTLVAGVGNIFQRDDAFGVEVVRLLAERVWPDGVEIADFGIRGVHLAYELLNGCELLVLVDAAARGLRPGTVTVLEIGPEDGPPAAAVMDAHGLAPDQVFAVIASLGSRPGRTLLVACEPADVSAGMGLSDQVREAIPHAVNAVEEILQQEGVQHHDQPTG